MVPLAAAVKNNFQVSTGIPLTVLPSRTSLQDLAAGRADVVILGREPSQGELTGLQDTVVAYDAVCILINARAYNGGMQQGKDPATGLIIPQEKFDGIQNMSLDQVKQFESNILGINHGDKVWYLPTPPFLTFMVYTDPITNVILPDQDVPGQAWGEWDWNQVLFEGENYLTGEFDTQAVLLKKLGLSENLLNSQQISFASDLYTSEEELISARFEPEAGKVMSQKNSSYPFSFFLRQASRRITVRAIQHGFFLKALRIEGIDPLVDPKVIYDGSYPFSRRIHIISHNPASPQVQKLIQYLLSPQGQKLIAEAEYLPLPSNP